MLLDRCPESFAYAVSTESEWERHCAEILRPRAEWEDIVRTRAEEWCDEAWFDERWVGVESSAVQDRADEAPAPLLLICADTGVEGTSGTLHVTVRGLGFHGHCLDRCKFKPSLISVSRRMCIP